MAQGLGGEREVRPWSLLSDGPEAGGTLRGDVSAGSGVGLGSGLGPGSGARGDGSLEQSAARAYLGGAPVVLRSSTTRARSRLQV